MFDIGWTELLVIGVVLIVVVGPKDLPPMLRAFGKMTGNLRKMAGEFRSQFDEALRETEMDEVRKTIADAQKLNPTNALRDAINPLRQMGQEIRSDLEKSTRVPPKADIEAQQVVEGVIPAEQPEPASVPAPATSPPATSLPATSLPDTPAAMPAEAPKAARPARKKAAPAKAAPADEKVAGDNVAGDNVAGDKAATAPRSKRSRTAAAASAEPAAPTPRKRVRKKAEGPKDEA